MARKRKLSLDGKINALTRLVQKGFAAIADDIAHRPTNSSVAGIIENYVPGTVRKAIREEVPSIVRGETKDVRDELADIRRDLKGLTSRIENMIGLTKEIDHALDRIRRIERHLGIEADIAA